MDERVYCVCITTNERQTVLYTGVTGDFRKRVFEHKQKIVAVFTSRYNANRLVYYEAALDPLAAIAREKQIKAGSRSKKIRLIESMNPAWRDVYDEL